jgi:PKD repeat protein
MGGVPLNVHLFDAGSYDPNGEVVMWEWNFGDAMPGDPAWRDYTESTGDAWHLYGKPGTKVAHLRVTDNDGNKDVAFVKIEMSKEGNANPVADAGASPVYGFVPLTVSFDSGGSYDPDGDIVKWEWDFDDGLGFQDFTGSAGRQLTSTLRPV